ncbi:hypothetical protein [Nesterenkonia sp. PF2B19]|uniref:hypothetical protein n=1 Tax=Nesterenkonia sp. PF2B19 TaxID=1881858 RepID=UPI001F2C4984|nr:hypothetical protein [Nesterenkonia sp. PF2B19]
MQLSTDAGERHAPLVVLAGGARSRHLVHPGLQAHTYPDRYLMTDAEVPDDDSRATAVVHLTEAGVLESFPLPGGAGDSSPGTLRGRTRARSPARPGWSRR